MSIRSLIFASPLFRLFWLGLVLAAVSGNSLAAKQSLTPVAGKPPAPAFSLKDMDGETHRLSDFRGKAVIVNFWATWCPPCRAELPSMNRAWTNLKNDDVVMIAINVGEDEDTIFSFMGDYPIDFLTLMDQDSRVIGNWPVKGLPTTFVVDPQGQLIYRAIGSREWDDPNLLEMVRQLNQKK